MERQALISSPKAEKQDAVAARLRTEAKIQVLSPDFPQMQQQAEGKTGGAAEGKAPAAQGKAPAAEGAAQPGAGKTAGDATTGQPAAPTKP